MYEITTNLALYKKDKKFNFLTKAVISKNAPIVRINLNIFNKNNDI